MGAVEGGPTRASPHTLGPMWGVPRGTTVPSRAGAYREPTLSAQPGSLVQPGDDLTLQCHSEARSDAFALTKDEGLTPPVRLDGQPSPDFPLGPVSSSHGGRYRCYGGHNLSSTWSAPSAPLDILVTGEAPTPHMCLLRVLGPWSPLGVTGSRQRVRSRDCAGA